MLWGSVLQVMCPQNSTMARCEPRRCDLSAHAAVEEFSNFSDAKPPLSTELFP